MSHQSFVKGGDQVTNVPLTSLAFPMACKHGRIIIRKDFVRKALKAKSSRNLWRRKQRFEKRVTYDTSFVCYYTCLRPGYMIGKSHHCTRDWAPRTTPCALGPSVLTLVNLSSNPSYCRLQGVLLCSQDRWHE